MMDLKDIIVELQSYGLKSDVEISGRKGGAGPSEGITLLIVRDGEEIPVNIPFYSHYVSSSPFTLKNEGEILKIFKNGIDTGLKVKMRGEPHYYRFKTEEGVPFWKIALLHGKDCIGTTIFQTCVHYGKDEGCKFCGIGISLKDNKTIPFKKPEEIYITAKTASMLDGVKHITITTGTQKDRRKEVLSLARAGNYARKAGLNVHIQFSPVDDVKIFEEIKDMGVDTIAIHIETLDEDVLKIISPWKSDIGLKNFLRNWEKGVEVFGWGQVSSFVIIGFGEDLKKTLNGIKMLSSIGVFPFLVPFRPIPGTPFYEKFTPPEPERMKMLYERTAEILHLFKLNPENFRAGCLRCGACSAIRLYCSSY